MRKPSPSAIHLPATTVKAQVDDKIIHRPADPRESQHRVTGRHHRAVPDPILQRIAEPPRTLPKSSTALSSPAGFHVVRQHERRALLKFRLRPGFFRRTRNKPVASCKTPSTARQRRRDKMEYAKDANRARHARFHP